jgi:hypothetical protein
MPSAGIKPEIRIKRKHMNIGTGHFPALRV